MGDKGRKDAWRRAATVVGALFQVLAAALIPIGSVASETPSLVIPAGYAFAIWGPIFGLCLVYAAYQALPSKRESHLLRRIGWPFAGAFFLNGLWEVSVPLRQPVLLQALIAGIFACLAVAYLRLARTDHRVFGGADRGLVALPLGLLFGWITAANAVSLNDALVQLGVMGTGVGAALVGSALLLLGALVASAAILAGKTGPPQAYLAYAAAVLWALVGVVLNQYDASLLTTGAALLAFAPVTLALLAPRDGRGGA